MALVIYIPGLDRYLLINFPKLFLILNYIRMKIVLIIMQIVLKRVKLIFFIVKVCKKVIKLSPPPPGA